MRFVFLLTLLPLALWLSGCVSLRSFTEIRREIPADRFVRVGEQLVHIEQAGAGEPVVLLHGFGGSTYSWREVMPALARSYRVVAIDLNGFGYTQRPKSRESYTREGQGKLVLAVLDALGIERAHIFGHSYGGGLTLYLASRHPERFRSMVLVDSSAPTYSDDRRSRVAALRPLTELFVRSVALRPGMIRKALPAFLLGRLPGHPGDRPGLSRPAADRGRGRRLRGPHGSRRPRSSGWSWRRSTSPP